MKLEKEAKVNKEKGPKSNKTEKYWDGRKWGDTGIKKKKTSTMQTRK